MQFRESLKSSFLKAVIFENLSKNAPANWGKSGLRGRRGRLAIAREAVLNGLHAHPFFA